MFRYPVNFVAACSCDGTVKHAQHFGRLYGLCVLVGNVPSGIASACNLHHVLLLSWAVPACVGDVCGVA